jgi:O-succinylbenzoate synthase
VLRAFDDHREAVAAVEAALVDAECRAGGTSLAAWLARQLSGADASAPSRPTVPAGVALGLGSSPGQSADAVARLVAAGYQRVKVKIGRSSDAEVLRVVRERVGDGVELFADANAAYGPDDLGHLSVLDEFALGCLEQPFGRDDLASHAALARMMSTPVCLDESVRSLDELCEAADLGACSVLNLKWSRVGGLYESVRVLRECRRRGIDLWIGGMLSSGVGRAVDVALASLEPVTMTGDISESARYFTDDLTTPFEMVAGEIAVPAAPGLGVEIDIDRIEAEASMHRSSRD